MDNDVVQGIVIIMVVGMTCGIPLLGLTLRFSLKPVVEAFIRLREAQLGSQQLQQLRDRVAYLERELELRGMLDRSASAPMQPLSQPTLSALAKDRERS